MRFSFLGSLTALVAMSQAVHCGGATTSPPEPVFCEGHAVPPPITRATARFRLEALNLGNLDATGATAPMAA